MKKLHIPPLGWLARFADWLMTPIMYLLSGTLKESPQRTHAWNNMRLSKRDASIINLDRCVWCDRTPSASPRFFLGLPLFHMPVFGGWKEYVVLEPWGNHGAWHIGWITETSIGVSRLTLHGPVRMLLGSTEGAFFGISAEGKQIPLTKVGVGTIGSGYLRTDIPLL